jgi:lipid II:glycine glycyltransferase (peptidoglycan interpeptide bridge formation enzyme)
MLYVPKGPVLDWANEDVATRVLADLEGLARHRRALLIKIDPDVFYPDDQISFVGHSHAPEAEQLLQSRGWRYSSEQIQFRNTALLDLRSSEEELLANMKSKTRYNVRLAARRGVRIRRGDRGDLGALYELYAETSQRNRFIIRPEAYYKDTWGTFLDCGLARFFLAEVDAEPIAGLVLFVFGDTAWYFYGASSDRHRSSMPSYLLQWEAVRAARSAGCVCYDMWGAPDRMDEDDPLWGVWRFKAGFGPARALGLGAWDYAPHSTLHCIYGFLLRRYVGWMQKRHRSHS